MYNNSIKIYSMQQNHQTQCYKIYGLTSALNPKCQLCYLLASKIACICKCITSYVWLNTAGICPAHILVSKLVCMIIKNSTNNLRASGMCIEDMMISNYLRTTISTYSEYALLYRVLISMQI